MGNEDESLAADLCVTRPRRAPGWGLFFMITGILALPAGVVAINASSLRDDAIIQKAEYELGRDDLSIEQREKWRYRATTAEADQKIQEDQQERRSLLFQYIFLPIAAALFLLGRRLRVPDAYEVMERDPRPPVVYLRSFAADGAGESGTFVRRSDEEKLMKLLRQTGPVIAVGKPNERLAPLGAARLYVSERRWQEVVDLILREARLIVIRAGNTPGLLWEMRRLRERVSPERILLFNPPILMFKPKAVISRFLAELRRGVSDSLNITIPEECWNERLIVFDEKWRAYTTSIAKLPEIRSEGQVTALRELLAELRREESPAPPFKLHPLSLLLCLALLTVLLRPPLTEDILGIWPLIACFNLLATLIIAVAVSFYVWLYISQKRWLLTSVFCFAGGVVLLWNFLARAEEKKAQVEDAQARHRLAIYDLESQAYDKWICAHEGRAWGKEVSEPDDLALGELTKSLKAISESVEPQFRYQAFTSTDDLVALAKLNISYWKAWQQFYMAGGLKWNTIYSRAELNRRQELLKDVRAHLEGVQQVFTSIDDRTPYKTSNAWQVIGVSLKTEFQFCEVTEQLLQLRSDEWANWSGEPESEHSSKVEDEVRLLIGQRDTLEEEMVSMCQYQTTLR